MSPCLLPIILFLAATLALTQRLQTQQATYSLRLSPVNTINITFQEFKFLYRKQYNSVAEQNYRKHIFMQNIKRMNRHNRNTSRTYNMKYNNFLDVSSSQFKQTFTGIYKSDGNSKDVLVNYHQQRNHHHTPGNKTHQRNNITSQPVQASNISIISHNKRLLQSNQSKKPNADSFSNKPTSAIKNIDIDWSLYAGSIRYQGLCGACYAFTSVDTLSAISAINKYGFFVPLSVQQVIDCADNGLTFGCSGGYLQGAFTHIQLYGINTQQNYPYVSVDSGRARKCKQAGGPFKLSSFSSIEEGDCKSVLTNLQKGPVSAGIAGYNLQFYSSGVFNDCDAVLDHAVVVIGFRSGLGWRIKNSWGPQWGEGGYGWVAQGNTCGICNMAVRVVV